MHHGLFVAGLVVAKFRHLLERLTDAGDIAMTKDAKTPGEKGLLYPIALHVLVLEKCDDGLGRCQTSCCLLIHIRPLVDPGAAPLSIRSHRGLE